MRLYMLLALIFTVQARAELPYSLSFLNDSDVCIRSTTKQGMDNLNCEKIEESDRNPWSGFLRWSVPVGMTLPYLNCSGKRDIKIKYRSNGDKKVYIHEIRGFKNIEMGQKNIGKRILRKYFNEEQAELLLEFEKIPRC